ncbi:hypothetical protein BKA62DRAFT_86173 [Auriculariales sp. MPI-PUGE-AT-0066]|nr:hypothetical protein BKA62DRAFT_86173 [Auriculariales sp. MPI-PUGE-AT-0066]
MYLVLADEAAGRRLPSAYLAELQRSFASNHDASYISSAPSSSFHDFELRLAEIMKYNENPPKDAFGTARNELDLVKDISTTSNKSSFVASGSSCSSTRQTISAYISGSFVASLPSPPPPASLIILKFRTIFSARPRP